MDEVWMAHLDLSSDAGRGADDDDLNDAKFVSVHRTHDGAVAKLIEFAARIGVVATDYDKTSGTSKFLDNHDHVMDYAVRLMPIDD